MARPRRSFGALRKLPSGRWQARYLDPHTSEQRSAPHTYDTRAAAEAFLARVQAAIVEDRYVPPAPAPAAAAPDEVPTVRAAADAFMAGRELKPRTRHDYQRLLDRLILPRFGDRPADAVTDTDVKTWHAAIRGEKGQPVPTQRAHAYGLLRTIFADLIDSRPDLVLRNPCRIKGGSTVKRAKRIDVATLDELAAMIEATPDRLRLLILLAAWCQLRFGELTALRRRDIDVKAGVVRVQTGVTRTPGAVHVLDPKTVAGTRDVTVPPHILAALTAHLLEHTGPRRDSLLFPSVTDPDRHLAYSVLWDAYDTARTAAGRPDLTVHGLRHTGATLSARAGATIAELMARLGHSTPGAAMRYQHAARDRDREIAARLSELAGQTPAGDLVDLDTQRRTRKTVAQ